MAHNKRQHHAWTLGATEEVWEGGADRMIKLKLGMTDREADGSHRERAILYPTRAHKSIHSHGLVFKRALKDPALEEGRSHTHAPREPLGMIRPARTRRTLANARIAAFWLASIPLGAATEAQASGSGDVAAKVAEGRALLRAGRPKEAEALLKRAAVDRGNSTEALYDLARVHFATDDYNKAREACRPLVAKAPENAFSNLCMAQAFLTWRRATRAAEFVEKARQSAPDQPEVYQVLGDLKRIEGDAAASEAAYRKVLNARPDDPDANFGLGQLYLIKPDNAAAAKAFRAALAQTPDWPDALYQLGRLTNGPEAVQLLERALKARPTWSEAKVALGEALLGAGDTARSEQLFREVLKQNPNLPVAHARLGMALLARDDLGKAEAELKKGLEGLPNDADAALSLARVYARTERPEDAFEAYRNAASREVNGSRALVEAGSYALTLERSTLAQGFLEKAVERTPSSATAQARLADALLARGEKDKAKQHYQLALRAQGQVDRVDIQRRIDALK
jgi:tetratricopeptide (TPR) repeat protein